MTDHDADEKSPDRGEEDGGEEAGEHREEGPGEEDEEEDHDGDELGEEPGKVEARELEDVSQDQDEGGEKVETRKSENSFRVELEVFCEEE